MEQLKQWEQWHEDRMQTLHEPYGWLTLISLDWIGTDTTTLETFPGQWRRENDQAVATFTAEDQVEKDGEPVIGEVRADRMTLTDGEGRQAEVAPRFGEMMVRVRTREVPPRTIPLYDYDPNWVITGPWEATDDSVEVRSAQPFGTHTLQGTGYTTINGQRMLLTDSLIFSDPTGWRVAPATVTGDTVTVDFNRSTIFPAHLTPYGTCPTAPASNHFNETVEAGEKSPA